MILRTIHNRDNPYFQLNRAAVNDERLSYKALGIHTYLMSKPDGWEANEEDIAARHTDGITAVRSGIQELINTGYMARIQLRSAGRIAEWRLDTYETPDLNPYYDPDLPGQFTIINLDTQEQEAEPLDPGFLDNGNLNLDGLHQDNQPHSKYNNVVNKEKREKAFPHPNANQGRQTPSSHPVSPAVDDPFVTAAKARFERNGAAGWQAELNLRLGAAQRVPLVNAIGKACGLTALMNGPGDTLQKVHVAACWFHENGYDTPEKIEALHRVYLSDDWRRERVPRPSLEAFAKFASAQLDELPAMPEIHKPAARASATNGNGQQQGGTLKRMQVFAWNGE